ncbi:HNH endonuclease [Endobacterium cereale]|uniref:HNH endonuclease n=1 Tax=Endobacterium cereale TaxID=2663029 RepID=UPI001F2B772C|nr:HNH endonuclease signature motif containing protein [Endobacterium cereale]
MTVIDGDELMVVSGIQDYPRRVRELRVQLGWQISSGATFKDMANDLSRTGNLEDLAAIEAALGRDPLTLRTDQYVLLSLEEDREAAHRWNNLNEIRRSKASVQDKLLRYMLKNIGRPVLGEELRYLAGDRNEWPRRMRELRTEGGWSIATKMSGRPDLNVGTYVLETGEPAPEHDRHIPDAVRVDVLIRDKYRCQWPECGWERGMAAPNDPRKLLELHHVVHHRDKGTNTTGNLITLCNTHHDLVHKDQSAAKVVETILAEAHAR